MGEVAKGGGWSDPNSDPVKDITEMVKSLRTSFTSAGQLMFGPSPADPNAPTPEELAKMTRLSPGLINGLSISSGSTSTPRPGSPNYQPPSLPATVKTNTTAGNGMLARASRGSWADGLDAERFAKQLLAWLLEQLGGSVVLSQAEIVSIMNGSKNIEVLEDDRGNTIYRVEE